MGLGPKYSDFFHCVTNKVNLGGEGMDPLVSVREGGNFTFCRLAGLDAGALCALLFLDR
jgi:hypothetical protein